RQTEALQVTVGLALPSHAVLPSESGGCPANRSVVGSMSTDKALPQNLVLTRNPMGLARAPSAEPTGLLSKFGRVRTMKYEPTSLCPPPLGTRAATPPGWAALGRSLHRPPLSDPPGQRRRPAPRADRPQPRLRPRHRPQRDPRLPRRRYAVPPREV